MTPLLLQALILSWMPGAFWLVYVESRSPQRSSLSRLAVSLVGGGLSVLGVFGFHAGVQSALGLNLEVPPDGLAGLFLYFTTVVGLLEETCKLLAVLLFCYPRRDFREPWDGLACATAVALGFATVENFKYVLDFGDASVLLGRFFLATFAHVVMSGIWGYALGLWKQARTRISGRVVLEALAWAAVFHGAYDFFLTIAFTPAALAVFLGLVTVFRQRLQEAYFTSLRRIGSTQAVRECRSCRALGRAEYAFCPRCGAQDDWKPETVCLNCLEPVSEGGQETCSRCGRTFT